MRLVCRTPHQLDAVVPLDVSIANRRKPAAGSPIHVQAVLDWLAEVRARLASAK